MSANIQFNLDTSICELRITGILKHAELKSCEHQLADLIAAGERPRVLVILENFAGWEQGEEWSNLDFMFTHGEKIAKIAVVGAGNKEAEVKVFTGAGMRPTPVEFFAADQLPAANAWLLE